MRGRVTWYLALHLTVAGCAGGPEPPPNLLLITIDTLRADELECYGGRPGIGAKLCGLFADGTRFRWAFSTAPYTAPSVASLLTSRYPAYHGVTQSALSYLRNEDATVAEILRSAGYTTAAFVSNPVLDGRNLGQGFEVFDQTMTRRERNRPGYAERAARETTDAALAWAQVAIREPWFVWVHFQDPHGPYEPPDARARRDLPGDRRLPLLEVNSGKEGIPAYQALPGLRSYEAYVARYREEIAYLEPHLERLVAGLDRLGRPPAILLTSDHGEALGEDGYYFAHGHSVGLDQIRVPLLFRGAAPGSGEVVDEPVSLTDLAPTLLGLAGLEAPEAFQGVALPVPGIGRSALDPDRAIFSEHGRRAAVIRGARFYSRDRRPELEGRRDRELGQEMPELPARTATLEGDGALPRYEPAGETADTAELEPLLAGFLHRTRGKQGLQYDEVPEDVLERMRALGYTED